jgi:hypothetical protein
VYTGVGIGAWWWAWGGYSSDNNSACQRRRAAISYRCGFEVSSMIASCIKRLLVVDEDDECVERNGALEIGKELDDCKKWNKKRQV